MADTRINALTTATVSISDDFLPIDGTTAGTKKLSAFSPSFGGNATVGGTLTVSGSGDSTLTGPISWGTTTPANAVLVYKNSNTKYGNGVTSGSFNNFVPSGDNKHSWGYMSNIDGTTYTELARLTANTGVLAVLSTTASTSTSSGALVVGNGSSGGLGVGGAIFAGGNIQCNAVFAANSTTLLLRPNGASVSSGQLSVETSGNTTVGGTLTVTGNLTNGELHVTNGTSGHSRSIYSLSGVGKTEIGYGPNGYGFAHPTASYISYVDGLYFGVAAGATSMTLSTSGNLTVAGTTISLGGGSGSIASVLNGAAGNYKLHLYQSGGVDRWYCGIQAAAETGSNAGAPFGITALSDAGAQIDIPLQIVRAAGGSIFFGRPVKAQDTTASTSAITGALVVGSGGSGGLGVAGAIVTGGIVRCGGSNGLSLGSDTGNIRIDSAGPAGVEFRGLSAADTITGFTMREMALIDGTAAPSTRAGYATIYVDTADGDLKVKFGDGTVKTIATDT